MFCKVFQTISFICCKTSVCNLTKNNTPSLEYFTFSNDLIVSDPETRRCLYHIETSLFHLETRLVSTWRDHRHERFKRCLKFLKPIQPRHEFSSVSTDCFALPYIFSLVFLFEKVLIYRLWAFRCSFCLFFIINTLFFWSVVETKLISDIHFWSTRKTKSYVSHNTLCYIEVYAFPCSVFVLIKASQYDKSVYLLTCVMLTQSCCYLKNCTCTFIGLKKIHRFLIYLWISKRFVDISLFWGFEKDLSIFSFFMVLKKIYRYEYFSWI